MAECNVEVDSSVNFSVALCHVLLVMSQIVRGSPALQATSATLSQLSSGSRFRGPSSPSRISVDAASVKTMGSGMGLFGRMNVLWHMLWVPAWK